ncbi:cobalamin B12-binding domain-containing protein [Qipengyuania sp.]|uniref:cobalamin B12-binding domain-containing protein n=1 Tax=Qipengyuania sp. TaxID=2004515 RepID=UPI003AF7A6C5
MAKGIANSGAGLRATSFPTASMNVLHSYSGASLCKMVEGDIIPRLLLAHRGNRRVVAARLESEGDGAATLTTDEIERFSDLPLQLEASDLLDKIEQYLARGISAERIFVDLLASSARKLGELWEQDECDFVDVTMGLWRLQEVMRIVAMRSPNIVRPLEAPPSALFAPMPGDQHSFGAIMIEEVFSRAGWESEVLFEPKSLEIINFVSQRSFDVVGLTVTNDCPSGDIAELVAAIRSVSRNPAVRIIVGGRVIKAEPSLCYVVGADGTASDAVSALEMAERMVAEGRPVLGLV